MAKAGVRKLSHGLLWAEMTGGDESRFTLASLEGGSTASIVGQLIGNKDLDRGWKYGYCVLEWRVKNDIVY